MNILISMLVIAGLLFGGGTAVSAAQDDLPDQPLYQLKLLTEGVSLQFQNRPEEKVERLMELAQNRVQEMVQLAEEGNPVPDQVRQRLEQHIQQALQVCSEMEDAELEGCLAQLQQQLQHQYREMEQLMTNVEPIMEQTRAMLRLHLNLVEDGLLDPAMFRNTVRNGFRFGQEEDFVPPAQNGSGHQNGQPESIPGGPNTDPANPHGNEVGPQLNDGGPNNVNGDPNSNNGGDNSNGNQGDGGSNGGDNGGGNSGGENGGGDSGGGGNGGGN